MLAPIEQINRGRQLVGAHGKRTAACGAALRHSEVSIGSSSLPKQPRRRVPRSPHRLQYRVSGLLFKNIEEDLLMSCAKESLDKF